MCACSQDEDLRVFPWPRGLCLRLLLFPRGRPQGEGTVERTVEQTGLLPGEDRLWKRGVQRVSHLYMFGGGGGDGGVNIKVYAYA